MNADTPLTNLLSIIEDQQNQTGVADQVKTLSELLNLFIFYCLEDYSPEYIKEVTADITCLIKFISNINEAYDEFKNRLEKN